MRILLPSLSIAALTIIAVSCKKNSPSSAYSAPGSDTLLSSVWILDTADGWLAIDSVSYDNNQNITQLSRLTYSTSSMAISSGPQGYETFTFTYSGSGKLPVSYKLFSTYSGNPNTTESHYLVYDNQQRLIEDSTLGVTGNDSMGYTATNTGTRIIRYTYNGNQVVYTGYNSDLSVDLDTATLTNGSVTGYGYWKTTTAAIAIQYDGMQEQTMTSATYSTINNPLYRNGINYIWPAAQSLFESQTQGLSRKMQVGAAWNDAFNGSWTDQYTWSTDGKGRLTQGVLADGSGGSALQFRLHYY